MALQPQGTPSAEEAEFVIDGWVVNPLKKRIRKGELEVRIEPKAMKVLVYLASRAGDTVTREELESSLWAGRVVGYDALSNTIIKLRKAFGDDARNPRIIETISKTGYRLLPDAVEVDGSGRDTTIIGYGEERMVRPQVPDMPSIAVLAFDNMSADPDQEYFSDGLSEDLITELSRVPGLFVIARNSSFAYKGRNTRAQDLSAELGVRYILEGSVRKWQDNLRINVQLIDGQSGGHVWANRYDRPLGDVFTVQDEVTRDVLSALAPRLVRRSTTGKSYSGTKNVLAYDYFLRGREQGLLDTKESSIRAKSLLEEAIRIDPDFSLAYAHLCRNYTMRFINRWGPVSEQSLSMAEDHGNRAIELDQGNPYAYFSSSANWLWMKEHRKALDAAGRAVSLDPNFSDGHAVLGDVLMYMGQPSEALAPLERSMRLDPHYRSIFMHILAQAHFHLGEFDHAIDLLLRRLIRKPDSDISRALLASCYGHTERKHEARSQWEELLRQNPQYSLEHRCSILPYKRKADIDRFVKGLQKAGLA